MRPRYLLIPMLGIAALVLAVASVTAATDPLSERQQLGKSIFFDDHLSRNQNQACAACHGPEVGFTGPLADTNLRGAVYEGSVEGAFGNRKPPSAAYAAVSPILHVDKKGTWVGGNFWDGRATGEKLGNPAADQAQGPFLNPAEQALPDSACVVQRVCTANYAVGFEDVFGDGACDIAWPADVDTVCETPGGVVSLSAGDRAASDAAYDQIALAIAAYEASTEVTAFTSKYDQSFGGGAKLSPLERRGFALFQGKAGCRACHPSGKDALFTDFTFDNLGVPINPENPAFVNDLFVDEGLGGYLKTVPGSDWEDELGKQKVPTLRNVDLRPSPGFVKAYGHNGYFKSLEGIVHFYNTRDVLPVCPDDDHLYTEAEALAADCWPAPEVAENVNHDELGDLGLSADDEAAIVAFLGTLSDGYQP